MSIVRLAVNVKDEVENQNDEIFTGLLIQNQIVFRNVLNKYCRERETKRTSRIGSSPLLRSSR